MFKNQKTKKIGALTFVLALTITMGLGSNSWLSSYCGIELNPSFSQITLKEDKK